jgi:hypothetical protein
MGALLRFYFQIEPDGLSEDEFWKQWGRLEYVLKLNGTIT